MKHEYEILLPAGRKGRYLDLTIHRGEPFWSSFGRQWHPGGGGGEHGMNKHQMGAEFWCHRAVGGGRSRDSLPSDVERPPFLTSNAAIFGRNFFGAHIVD